MVHIKFNGTLSLFYLVLLSILHEEFVILEAFMAKQISNTL